MITPAFVKKSENEWEHSRMCNHFYLNQHMQFRSIILAQKDKICKRIHLGHLKKGSCSRISKVALVIKTYFIEGFAFQWIFISLSGSILTMSF